MTEDELSKFRIKDSITVEGITEDYVWYQAKLLTEKMSAWENSFARLVSVMEARHKEHLRIIDDLLREIKKLKEAKDGK
jgi:hypothetical protein